MSADRRALAVAALLTLAMAALMIWLVNVAWARLPPWLMLPLCLFLAVALIGTPIYALLKWSEARLARRQRDQQVSPRR